VLTSKVVGSPAPVDEPPRGTSWTAIAASAATVLAVAFVSGIPKSPYQPILPEGTDPLAPFTWVGSLLGLDAAGKGVLEGLAFGALFLAVGAFAFALYEAWRGRLPLRWVVGLAIAFHLVAFAMPLFVSRDVYHYAAYGRLASVHGVNPYVAAPSDFPSDPFYRFLSSDWRDTPALYGPVFVHAATLITGSVRSPEAVIWAFKGLAAMASLAAVFLLAWVARRAWPERAPFAAAALALNPVVLFSAVAGGHMDPLITLAIAGALGFVVMAGQSTSRRALGFELLATAALALTALMKSPLGVVLALHVIVSVLRRPKGERSSPLLLHLGVVLALAVPLVAPYLQFENPLLGTDSLSTVVTYLSPNAFWVMGGNLIAPLLGVWIGRVMILGARVGFPIAFLVGAFLVARLAFRKKGLDWREHGAAWGWTMVFFLLTAPILWPWYLLWALPMAWLLPWKPRATLIGLAAALPLLQVTGEPGRYQRLHEAGVVVGIFVLGPVLLVVLAWVFKDLRRAQAERRLAGVEEPT
jgi:alpha-1,6-mannosyltransferase